VNANPGEFEARLRALLDEARAAGQFEALRPLLGEALAGPEPVAAADATGPIPMRFGMVGNSPALRAVYALLEKVAQSEVSVLVHGETGTGKELVAKALHEYGPRKGKPFLAENCAAVPADLLESELFGHKKGSFTGAIARDTSWRPTRARCSSTRSATCRSRCSPSCCGCCRRARCAPSVRTRP
jgi:transcriptional regulator with GAF, ATPase, and Fis domain